MQHKNTISCPRAILFDFDGTLANVKLDFDLMRRKILALATAYVEDADIDEIPGLRTQPVLELVAALTAIVRKVLDRDESLEFNTRCRFTIMDMELAAARNGKLFGFVRPMLERLTTENIATGIITRNCTPAVSIVFPDWCRYTSVMLAREDVTNPKPAPDHALAALTMLDIPPQEALLIGDHPLDILAARNAGCLAGGVLTGHASREQLENAAPDWLGKDCMEILTAVLGW